jgi:hypothetical protein
MKSNLVDHLEKALQTMLAKKTALNLDDPR